MLSLKLHTATFKMKSLISRVFVALLLCVALTSRQTHVCAQDAPIDAVNNTTPVIDNSIGVIPAEAVPVNEDVPVDGADEDSELEFDPIPEDGDVPSTVQAGDVTDPVDTQNDVNDVVVDVVDDDADNLDHQEVDVDIPENEADIFADQDLDPDFDANLNDEFFDEDVGDVTEVVDEIELDTVNDNGTTIVDAINFADLEAGVERIVFAYHLPPGVTEEAALANLPVLLLEILPVDDVEIVLKIVDEYYLGVFEVLAGEADFTESSPEAIISNHDELETIVVETYANGKHYHEILALTHEDGNIESFGQLEGKRACFSKFDDNAGMKLPIGYYLRTNQMPAGSDLEDTITSFFSNGSCAEPVLCETCKDNNVNGNCNDVDLYAGYQGAMECLIEKAGEVAFIRDIDIDVPGDEAMADHIRPFVTIPMDGVRLPSHTVVIKKPGANRRQANATRAELIRDHLRAAFLSITADDPISQYLHSNHGYTTMGMDSQLSGFEENIACVPGLSLGLQCQTEADNSVAGNSSTPANATATATDIGTTNDTQTVGAPFETSSLATVRIAVAQEITQAKKDQLFELFTTGLLLELEFIPTSDHIEAVLMIGNGTADLAIADAYASMVAVGMELDAIAVQQIAGGDYYHRHQAWTLGEEHAAGLRDFEYSEACFPGFGLDTALTTSIGYQIRHGLIVAGEDLEVTVRQNYLESCAEPNICQACQGYDYLTNNACNETNQFAGYAGAIRCITDREGGQGGRVAFVRDDTVASTCGQPNPPDWCLAEDEYEMIADFGEFPSNAIIYDPLRMDDALETRLRHALDVAKDEDNTTLVDHHEAYNTIFSLSLAEHIDEFSKNVACVPGIKELLGYPNITLQECVLSNHREGTRDDPIRFAYYGNQYNIDEIKADLQDAVAGFEFEVVRATDATHALRMVLNHEADFASVDPALALKGIPFALIPLAYETYLDNVTTFYNAEVWTRTDSGITNFTDSQFLSSCHGSATSSAGMYYPVGYGIRKGYMNVTTGQSITDVAKAYWSKGQCAQPELCDEVLCQSSQLDDNGQLECPIQGNLPQIDSEDASALQCLYYGGSIAFIREGAMSLACDFTPEGQSQNLICRERENYHKIMDLGKVPTDIVITQSRSFMAGKREQFQEEFVNAYGNTVAGVKLRQYFGDHASYMVAPRAYDLNAHMHNYKNNVACLPDVADVLGLGVLSEPTCTIDSGRDGDIEPIRFAYVADRSYRDTTNLTILLNELSGLTYEVLWAKTDHMAMDMIKNNQADLAYVDIPAAVYGMATDENIHVMAAAYAPVTNLPYLEAQAWVLTNSSIQSIADTKGTNACHPAMRSSAGMYMWLQYAISENLIEPTTLSEDYITDTGLDHLTSAIETWFQKSCAEPQLCSACADTKVDGLCNALDDYAGLVGALKCLTQGGGDVAFLPDHAWEQICEEPLPENEVWCLSKDSYTLLHTFGEVPTRMFMSSNGRLTSHSHSIIDGLLLELEPREIAVHAQLNAYFDNGRADGYARTTDMQTRMDTYMQSLACVPDVYYLMGLPDEVELPSCDIRLNPNVAIQGEPISSPSASAPIPSTSPSASAPVPSVEPSPSSSRDVPVLNIDLNKEIENTPGQTTTDSSSVNDEFTSQTSANSADANDDSIESLAIAAIVLAVLFLVSVPFVAFGLARKLNRRWLWKNGLDGATSARGSNASTFDPNSFESTTSTTNTATAVDVNQRPSDLPMVGTNQRLV